MPGEITAEMTMQVLPLDNLPHWCPTWEEIEGKAIHYETARLRATGRLVKIVHVDRGLKTFVAREQDENNYNVFKTEDLCDFVL